jgi:hypothetical protein
LLALQRPPRPLFAFSGLARPFFAFSGIIHLIFAAYFYTGTSYGSNTAVCCNNFFPASCHIRTCSLESRGKAQQKLPDSVPADVKALLQKFPSILRTEDVKLTPTHFKTFVLAGLLWDRTKV